MKVNGLLQAPVAFLPSGLHSQSERCGEEKPLPCWESNPGLPTHSLVTVLTELSRLCLQRATNILSPWLKQLKTEADCWYLSTIDDKNVWSYSYTPEVLKLSGPQPRGALLVICGEARCLYGGHIYFERNMDAKWNIYFGKHFAWLKYFTYHLAPILVPNCKQHILLLAKVKTKYVIHCLNVVSNTVCLFAFFSGGREHKVHETS
jgi:hypothetical protein